MYINNSIELVHYVDTVHVRYYYVPIPSNCTLYVFHTLLCVQFLELAIDNSLQ